MLRRHLPVILLLSGFLLFGCRLCSAQEGGATLFPFGDGAGDAKLNASDDESSPAVPLSTPVVFYEHEWNSVFVSLPFRTYRVISSNQIQENTIITHGRNDAL